MIPNFPNNPQDLVTWGKSVSTLLRDAETNRPTAEGVYTRIGGVVHIEMPIIVAPGASYTLPVKPRSDGFLVASDGTNLFPVHYINKNILTSTLPDGSYFLKGSYIASKEL